MRTSEVAVVLPSPAPSREAMLGPGERWGAPGSGPVGGSRVGGRQAGGGGARRWSCGTARSASSSGHASGIGALITQALDQGLTPEHLGHRSARTSPWTP